MKSNTRRKLTIGIIILIPIVILTILLVKESNFEFDFRKVNEISFSQLNNMSDIQDLKGKKVKILGYMSPNSAYGASYIYLSSKPYATDVFKEGTFNSIAVYSKDNKIIEYSNYPVYVTGDLVLGDFKDTQDFSYKYRIENAQIENATLSQVSGLVKKYLILAQDNVLDGLNAIFGQIDMLIYFDEYKELGYIKEEDLSKIDIEGIDTLIQRVEQYNDETYNTIKSVLEQLKTVGTDLNGLIDKKNYDKLVEQKEQFEKVYYEFYYYIAEFGV